MNPDGVHRWELRGVGHLNPQLVGDSAAIDENDQGTIVIGEWHQSQVIDLIRILMTSGFELDSVRRLVERCDEQRPGERAVEGCAGSSGSRGKQ